MKRRGFLASLAGAVAGLFGAGRAKASEANKHRLGIIKFPAGKAMILPPDAKTIGVSPHICFMENLLAAKVQHKDLPEVPEAHRIPEVKPCYDELGVFTRWEILG